MQVVNCTLYRDNPYQQLLYRGILDRYEPLKGDVDEAIKLQRGLKNARQILHIHWEEHVIRHAQSSAEAFAMVEFFLARLAYFKKLGGYVVWTVHNILPHEQEWEDAFLALRRGVAEAAERICVHNLATIPLLRAQTQFKEGAPFLLPHPTYFGVMDPLPDQLEPETPTALIFGKLRPYKAIEKFIDAFGASNLPRQGAILKICGEGLKNQTYAQDLVETYEGAAPNVVFDIRRAPDEELPALFGGATAIILPYERLLTSGVLFAAMTLGAPVIAPRLPQVIESLPRENHAFLYDPDNLADAITAFERLSTISAEERADLRAALLFRAYYHRPERISRLLGGVYDLANEKKKKAA